MKTIKMLIPEYLESMETQDLECLGTESCLYPLVTPNVFVVHNYIGRLVYEALLCLSQDNHKRELCSSVSSELFRVT